MNSPAHLLHIPDSMGRTEIGAYLRELREYYKLTTQDVAERTHIRQRYILAMEEGRFEAMPGKAYARGYLHSYAEFLGLDADQVIAQCFDYDEKAAPKPAVSTSVNYPYGLSTPQHPLRRFDWRRAAIAGVAGIVLVLMVVQLMPGRSAEITSTPEVAPVPETMLASVRTRLMPTARNFPCLMSNQLLACYSASQATQMLEQLLRTDTMPFAVNVDGYVMAEPAVDNEPEHE